MRAIEHYVEAERLLTEPDDPEVGITHLAVAQAQVHATLALAGATALATYCRVEGSEGELADWEHAAGGEDE